MDAVSTPKGVRFGTYEVDLRSGELRKNGLKVRLTGQPFQILAILLERPGELVTREELQKRLWLGDTFVDFDSGLNAAVTGCAKHSEIRRKTRDLLRLSPSGAIASLRRWRGEQTRPNPSQP